MLYGPLKYCLGLDIPRSRPSYRHSIREIPMEDLTYTLTLPLEHWPLHPSICLMLLPSSFSSCTWSPLSTYLKPIIVLILYCSLSNLVHTISDPKGTHMNCLCVIQRCIKTHLYPVAFIGMCITSAAIVSEFLYFILFPLYTMSYLSCLHVRLIRVY